MPHFIRRLWACAILLISAASLAQASLQYCNTRSYVQLHLCLAVDTYYNTTSKATDLLATFGYQSFSAGGWTSVGLGSSMYGALVVIGYVHNGGPTLDLRQATGHFEPQSLPTLPQWTISSLAANTSGWFESSFHIYGYDSWLGAKGHNLGVQSFIWATSVAKPANKHGAAFSLAMHDDKGQFSFDLGAYSANNALSGSPQHAPAIHFGKKNDNVEDGGASVAAAGVPRAYVFYLHGVALVSGIMILYPAGALALRFTKLRPFRLHLYFQLGASMSCLVGFAAAGFAIRADPLRYLREPHVLLGLVILCGILLQNTLGWLHHRAYVNDAKNAFVTSAHILVGRFIIILGSANALLGLILARARPTTLVFLSTVFAVDVVVVSCIWLATRKRRDEEEKQEVGVPLLDDDSDGHDSHATSRM